jgi:hypothetical protein
MIRKAWPRLPHMQIPCTIRTTSKRKRRNWSLKSLRRIEQLPIRLNTRRIG